MASLPALPRTRQRHSFQDPSVSLCISLSVSLSSLLTLQLQCATDSRQFQQRSMRWRCEPSESRAPCFPPNTALNESMVPPCSSMFLHIEFCVVRRGSCLCDAVFVNSSMYPCREWEENKRRPCSFFSSTWKNHVSNGRFSERNQSLFSSRR